MCSSSSSSLISSADIKQYIGLPSAAAVFKIYHSCIQELMRVRERETTRVCVCAGISTASSPGPPFPPSGGHHLSSAAAAGPSVSGDDETARKRGHSAQPPPQGHRQVLSLTLTPEEPLQLVVHILQCIYNSSLTRFPTHSLPAIGGVWG